MPAVLLRYASFCASVSDTVGSTLVSNVNGLRGACPLTVWQGKYGPGLAFRYQLSQFGTGGERFVGGVVSSVFAQTLSTPAPRQGTSSVVLTRHPFAMCASVSGAALVPTQFCCF